jgi:hypothetical protein
MTRQRLAVLLLLSVVPACRSAGPHRPSGPAVLPPPLAQYQGEIRILRHAGDEQKVQVGTVEDLTGGCDVAVHVRTVALDGDTARFSLDNVGLPRVKGRSASCERARPGLLLFVEGVGEGTNPEVVTTRVDRVLQTPEAYLKSKGVEFDLAPGDVPEEVASREVHAPADEKMLGRQVGNWPEELLSVDPWYHHGSGGIRQEGEVKVEAIVGTDGRVHAPRVRTGMGASHEQAVLRVLPLWRFEPARVGDRSVGARLILSPILRIF